MSISALDNENGEMEPYIQALQKRRKWERMKMRKVTGTTNYRMGYSAGLGGFNPDDATLSSYDNIYSGYAAGLGDGRRALNISKTASETRLTEGLEEGI